MLETFCNKSTIHALQTFRGFIAFHRLFEAPFRLKNNCLHNVEYSQINIFVALNVLIEGVCFVGENSPHLEGFSHGTKSFLCDRNGQKAPRSFPEDILRWNKIIALIFIVDVSIDWSISKVIINTKALFYTLFCYGSQRWIFDVSHA